MTGNVGVLFVGSWPGVRAVGQLGTKRMRRGHPVASCVVVAGRPMVAVMERERGRWVLRLVEMDDRSWLCRQGDVDLDRHDHVDDALHHIAEVADQHRPSKVYAHHRDGRVTEVLTLGKRRT